MKVTKLEYSVPVVVPFSELAVGDLYCTISGDSDLHIKIGAASSFGVKTLTVLAVCGDLTQYMVIRCDGRLEWWEVCE